MVNIEIYTKSACSYCHRAKALFMENHLPFKEISIEEEGDANIMRHEMVKRSGGRTTVPQIFINGEHIGGYDDLQALESGNGLNILMMK